MSEISPLVDPKPKPYVSQEPRRSLVNLNPILSSASSSTQKSPQTTRKSQEISPGAEASGRNKKETRRAKSKTGISLQPNFYLDGIDDEFSDDSSEELQRNVSSKDLLNY